MRESIWHQRGVRPLLVTTFCGFTGYAVLLPVAPLWVVSGGADTGGSGLVNGVLLLATVLTQLLVPTTLRRLGWGRVLGAGLVLLGLPSLLYALSDALAPVLALSAVRGVGFGILTVTGSAAVAALVSPTRRGAAIGWYGLAVALPQVGLLPWGPWVAGTLGYPVVFALGALPLVGVPAAARVSRALRHAAPDLAGPHARAERDPDDPVLPATVRLLRPVVLLLAATLAGGAVLTFTPQLVEQQQTASAALFLLTAVAAVSRWQAGTLADRYGPDRFLAPLALVTAAGAALVAWSVAGDGVSTGLLLAAAVVVGLTYGALQNLTLVVAFRVVSRRHHHLASAAWNIGFDAGTGLGSVAVGALAVQASFSGAFWLVAAFALAVVPAALVGTRGLPRPGRASSSLRPWRRSARRP